MLPETFKCESRVTLVISMITANLEIQWKRCSIPISMLILTAIKQTKNCDPITCSWSVPSKLRTKELSVMLYKYEGNHLTTRFITFVLADDILG